MARGKGPLDSDDAQAPARFKIPEPAPAGRLDAWLSSQTPYSRSQLTRLFRDGSITIDGKKARASEKLKAGSQIAIEAEPLDTRPTLQPREHPLSILFEDETLVVVDKAAAMTVHPGAGTSGDCTLVEALLARGGHDYATPTDERPGIVHRLDRDTTGALVWAKNEETRAALAAQFAAKTNLRSYLALCDGLAIETNVRFTSYLARDPADHRRYVSYTQPDQAQGSTREARATFEVQEVYAHTFSLMRVTLETGRTHQIRVQAQALGHPVWGDPVYGRARDLPKQLPDEVRQALTHCSRQMLHAETLGFRHPKSGKDLVFHAPLPPDFAGILGKLAPFAATSD